MRFAGRSAPDAAGCVGHFVIARAPALTAAMNDELSAFVRPSLSLMLLVSALPNIREFAVGSEAGATSPALAVPPALSFATSPAAVAVESPRGVSAFALGLELQAEPATRAAKRVNTPERRNGLEYITVRALSLMGCIYKGSHRATFFSAL